MLGVLKESTDVGVYKIAVQGASLAALGIVAANMVTMPYMSRFAASNDIGGLEKIAQKSARLSFAIALMVILIFGFFGDLLIILVFGQDYAEAFWPLLILGIGQIIHSGFGPGGTLLNMSGYERSTLFTLIASAFLNIILNFMFIPIWGIYGASIATSTSVLFRKVIIWIVVYVNYGIDSSAVGFKFNRNKVERLV
jgi:O-antigen/teichoic acid export membrane protein